MVVAGVAVVSTYRQNKWENVMRGRAGVSASSKHIADGAVPSRLYMCSGKIVRSVEC